MLSTATETVVSLLLLGCTPRAQLNYGPQLLPLKTTSLSCCISNGRKCFRPELLKMTLRDFFAQNDPVAFRGEHRLIDPLIDVTLTLMCPTFIFLFVVFTCAPWTFPDWIEPVNSRKRKEERPSSVMAAGPVLRGRIPEHLPPRNEPTFSDCATRT